MPNPNPEGDPKKKRKAKLKAKPKAKPEVKPKAPEGKPKPPDADHRDVRGVRENVEQFEDEQQLEIDGAGHDVLDPLSGEPQTYEQLRAMMDQMDYQYTVLKARHKLYERTLCKRALCVNCRMAIAELKGQLTGLEVIQQEITSRMNALS